MTQLADACMYIVIKMANSADFVHNLAHSYVQLSFLQKKYYLVVMYSLWVDAAYSVFWSCYTNQFDWHVCIM
jgi:hypothetical protein